MPKSVNYNCNENEPMRDIMSVLELYLLQTSYSSWCKPSILLALLACWYTCTFHVRFDATHTPRSLSMTVVCSYWLSHYITLLASLFLICMSLCSERRELVRVATLASVWPPTLINLELVQILMRVDESLCAFDQSWELGRVAKLLQVCSRRHCSGKVWSGLLQIMKKIMFKSWKIMKSCSNYEIMFKSSPLRKRRKK